MEPELLAVWCDGSVQPERKVVPPAVVRAFRYGDAVFATLSIERGLVLDLDRQLRRLAAAAAEIGVGVPETLGDPAAVVGILGALGAGPRTTAVARIQIVAAPNGRGYGRPLDEEGRAVVELFRAPAERRLRVVVLPDEAVPTPALPRVKSCSAIAHVLCARQAARRGVDEVLRVHRGVLAEAAAANVFWLRDDVLFTPEPSLPIYPGLTRAEVLRVARETGWEAREGRFRPESLAGTAGAFLTNAVRGIEPLDELDGTALPWPPALRELRAAVAAARRASGVALG